MTSARFTVILEIFIQTFSRKPSEPIDCHAINIRYTGLNTHFWIGCVLPTLMRSILEREAPIMGLLGPSAIMGRLETDLGTGTKIDLY